MGDNAETNNKYDAGQLRYVCEWGTIMLLMDNDAQFNQMCRNGMQKCTCVLERVLAQCWSTF